MAMYKYVQLYVQIRYTNIADHLSNKRMRIRLGNKRSLSSFSHDNFDGGKPQIMENVVHTLMNYVC